MKKGLWMSIAGIAVVVAGVTLVALPRAPEWTTSSPDALAAFEAATEAQSKVYFDDAYVHYRRAYELDPGFLIAKLRFAQFLFSEDPERAESLFVELENADLEGLTPRETLFIERWRAFRDSQPEKADRLLIEYVATYPKDAPVLSIQAGVAWNRGDLETAARLYRRLLEVEPNMVAAYNALGYIALMQGSFAESEEYFKSYRYIAPDQANPHDSLGELYITVGRFEEAEASLTRAIETKKDFWASYQHLAILHSFARQPHQIGDVIALAREAGMPDEPLAIIECLALYSELTQREKWGEILELSQESCVTERSGGYPSVMTHRAACETGDWQTAQTVEDRVKETMADSGDQSEGRNQQALRSVMNHLVGVRLAKQGRYDEAGKKLMAADDGLSFMEVGTGSFKLYNRMILTEIMLAAGDDATAHKMLAALRVINPSMVEEFENSGFRVLGLGRG